MLKLITSQLKIIPGQTVSLDEYALSSALILRNEPFSFQAAYAYGGRFQPVTLQIDSPLPAECWRVDCLPVTHAANDHRQIGYVTDAPGLIPDLLQPRAPQPDVQKTPSPWSAAMYFEEGVRHTLNASEGLQSVLITLNPASQALAPGKYPVTVTMRELNDLTEVARETLEIEVVDALLPEQDFCVTNWFHVDCLCDYYGCEPYSERFYQLFETFIRNMTRHRQNTLLLPAFTPALDTPIGQARRNVQLVDVERVGDEWRFDFTRLQRFMKTASECGIRYFEHCHLFSQWGATQTPNIYRRDGSRIFGWDTEATGAEYTGFIRAYLAAFIDFARAGGYRDEQLIFHISDEPSLRMLPDYRRALETVADLLAPFQCIDALSEMEFYRQGLIKTPVAALCHARQFAAECESFWVYYTGGPCSHLCSNRLLTNTAARTRVLGAQMYHDRARGFLHWGYNFYYDRMSAGFFDPKVNPCGYKQLPGCSYLAYPGPEGALPSLREIHMREAFDDLRALKLYEALTSREEAEALLHEAIGRLDNDRLPAGNALHRFSQSLKRAICRNCR